MGRRAKKAPVQTKKRPTLAKRFKCPFCANDEVVECKMDMKEGIGSLSCRLCSASYQMPIHHLHEPIDVFSEWLDDCEAAQTGAQPQHQQQQQQQQPQSSVGASRYDEDDDDLLNAEGLTSRKPAAASASGKGKEKQSYETLGLDDSDDDSE